MNQLIPIEMQNQRVLLTSQLAECYGTTERNIVDNFNNNKERYINGKHYHLLQGEALRQFKSENENFGFAPNLNKLYLWTERGALLHTKSLNTDRAWEVYDKLVESYFRVREKKISFANLSPELKMFKSIFDSVAKTQIEQQQQAKALQATNQRIDNIGDIISLDTNSWREDTRKLIVHIAQKMGGNDYIRDVQKEIYELVNTRGAVNLKIRLTNKRRRMADEGVCKSKRDRLNKMDVIADDKKLIEIYVAIVKEMCIKYGVAEKSA